MGLISSRVISCESRRICYCFSDAIFESDQHALLPSFTITLSIDKKEDDRLALDWKTLEYRPRQKAKFASLEMGKNIDDTGARAFACCLDLTASRRSRTKPARFYGRRYQISGHIPQIAFRKFPTLSSRSTAPCGSVSSQENLRATEVGLRAESSLCRRWERQRQEQAMPPIVIQSPPTGR